MSKTPLTVIPGIGPKMAKHLNGIGITYVEDLQSADPEDLYKRDSIVSGQQLDRCVLYVYRCAVYYASNDIHDPEKLKWWNWKK